MAFPADGATAPVVPYVVLEQFAGRWYEIARYPRPFESECVRDVTTTYTFNNGAEIKAVNRCRRADGSEKVTVGRGRVTDTATNAKFHLRFGSRFLNLLFSFYEDQEIVHLDADYRYSVLSDATQKQLWILSRTPQISVATYQMLLSEIVKKGFDVSPLNRTRQTGG